MARIAKVDKSLFGGVTVRRDAKMRFESRRGVRCVLVEIVDSQGAASVLWLTKREAREAGEQLLALSQSGDDNE